METLILKIRKKKKKKKSNLGFGDDLDSNMATLEASLLRLSSASEPKMAAPYFFPNLIMRHKLLRISKLPIHLNDLAVAVAFFRNRGLIRLSRAMASCEQFLDVFRRRRRRERPGPALGTAGWRVLEHARQRTRSEERKIGRGVSGV